MELSTLSLLMDVVRLGSFAAAARLHNVDPSTVSRLIAALEEELAIRLLQRSTRHLALTEAGEIYVARIQPMLEELAAAGEAARCQSHNPIGRLHLTASVAFGQTCLLPLLADFRRQYPDIQLDIRLTDAVVDLLAEEVDLACRLSPERDSNLIGTKLFDTRYHVCASPQYLSDQGQQQPLRQPQDLGHHDCLVFDLPGYRKRWLFQSADGPIEPVQVQSSVSISSALALKTCALQGMGPALLADWLVRSELSDGSLVDVFPHHRVTATDFNTGVWLLYPSRKFLPQKTRVMIDFFKTVLPSSTFWINVLARITHERIRMLANLLILQHFFLQLDVASLHHAF